MKYYTAFVIMVWLALALLGVLVFENDRIKKEEKGLHFLSYAVVGIAATAEWLGILFTTAVAVPVWLLKIVKFFDYILTPAAGGVIILQFRKTEKYITWSIFGILVLNFILQFICLFTDWMSVIDTSNDILKYSRGKLYMLYIAFYFVIILLVIFAFALYGRNFRHKNRASLYGILIFVVVGILLQVIFNHSETNEARTAYVAITIGLIALFVHKSEFSQQVADDQIKEQKILITIDPLTGIYNRYAYEKDLDTLEDNENLVVFSVDINGLKHTNDTKGHQAGDELICGAAEVITKVLNKYGKCYRTGGDEFIGLSHVSEDKIDSLIKELNVVADSWKGKMIDKLSLSSGFASRKEFPKYTLDELVGTADQRMYKQKSEYYLSRGIDRRKQ